MFFFFVTLHKLLISGGFVWNKYVCASAGSALLSDIALGHSSISLSLSLCLSVWGGGWRGIYRASDCRFSLKPLLGQIPHLRIPNNIPHTPLARNATTVWTVQGLILGTKWGRNRAMPRCVFVFVPVQHWCGAPKKKKKKNGTSRCQLISLPDPHRAQKLISTLVAIQVISLHLFLSLSVSGLMRKEISQRAEAAQTMRDTQPPLI